MQQLTCTKPGEVEWREVPGPSLDSDRAALVRPLCVARCDIDRFLTGGLFPVERPFALGHEGVGVIEALGDGVRGLEVGQRVVVSFQVSCGSCAACRAGHTAVCDRMPTLSDYGMQPLSGVEYGGMLSDTIRVPFAEAMLRPVPEGVSAQALASASDNLLDGYRAVAPHLRERSVEEMLIVSHGVPSIPLYAAQAALALGAGRVDFASGDPESLELAARLGCNAIELSLEDPESARVRKTYPLVVEAGVSPKGLEYAIRSTRPEGTCQSASFYPGAPVPMPLGRLYTLGIRFFIGRCHACALMPEVLDLVGAGRLAPERVTTQVVSWDDAPRAFLEPAIKLVVDRDH